jgi:Leucine-rich repeat (LRR) protein
VSNNTIVEIGSAFTDMPELKYLDLSYNHLPMIKKGAFRNLPSLVGLRLDYNSIIELVKI